MQGAIACKQERSILYREAYGQVQQRVNGCRGQLLTGTGSPRKDARTRRMGHESHEAGPQVHQSARHTASYNPTHFHHYP